MTLKHLKTELAFALMKLPLKGQWKTGLCKWGGVKILGTQHFIGSNVVFDRVAPERITIEHHVHITGGVVLLTHYLDTTREGIHWKYGDIHICKDAFIGYNTIISKPCTIGEGAIVGSGSVVTKDIPPHEIWAGNPARFIKKRDYAKKEE